MAVALAAAYYRVAFACAPRYPQDRHAMKHLTKEQQKVLCVIILLLLTGLAVKTWRRAHPPADPAVTAWPVQKP